MMHEQMKMTKNSLIASEGGKGGEGKGGQLNKKSSSGLLTSRGLRLELDEHLEGAEEDDGDGVVEDGLAEDEVEEGRIDLQLREHRQRAHCNCVA